MYQTMTIYCWLLHLGKKTNKNNNCQSLIMKKKNLIYHKNTKIEVVSQTS